MNYLGEIWKSFRSTIRGFDTPQQLALGFAFGILVGLIPKDSALPYLLGALAILTPANLLCLALGCVVASFTSPLLDGMTHWIGETALTYPPLTSMWATLYETPYVAWTRFENTVVMGNLILGLALLIPSYLVCLRLAKLFGPRLRKLVMENQFIQQWFIEEQEAQTPLPQEG